MVETGHLLHRSLTDDGSAHFFFFYVFIQCWTCDTTLSNNCKPNQGCLIVDLHLKKPKKKFKMAASLLWSVCLMDYFLLTQPGPDWEGKGPVHILLLSLRLPFASICHQCVLQYPRCLILLLTQGQPPPEDALHCAGGMAQNPGPQNGGTGPSALSMWRSNRQRNAKTNTWLVKNPHQVYCLSAKKHVRSSHCLALTEELPPPV